MVMTLVQHLVLKFLCRYFFYQTLQLMFLTLFIVYFSTMIYRSQFLVSCLSLLAMDIIISILHSFSFKSYKTRQNRQYGQIDRRACKFQCCILVNPMFLYHLSVQGRYKIVWCFIQVNASLGYQYQKAYSYAWKQKIVSSTHGYLTC